MSTIESASDEIVLIFAYQSMKCSRSVLTENSDYFKAMLEGSFLERNASSIDVKEIKFDTMKLLLADCKNSSLEVLEIEEMLDLLKAACLFLFESTRERLIKRLTYLLNPINCLRIWFTAELLDLHPLYSQARELALIEFNEIKHSVYLEEMEIKQLHKYLSNVYLQCKSEMDVFYVCMRWFQVNKLKEVEYDQYLITSLFSCMDFMKLSYRNIKEIMIFPHIADNEYFMNVLNCLIIKRTRRDISSFNDITIKHVEKLLEGNSRRNSEDHYSNIYIHNEVQVYKGNGSIFHEYSRNWLTEYLPDRICGGYKGEMYIVQDQSIYAWIDNSRWMRISRSMPHSLNGFKTCISGNNIYIIGTQRRGNIVKRNMYMCYYSLRTHVWSDLIKIPIRTWYFKFCNHQNQLFVLNSKNWYGYLFDESSNSFTMLNVYYKNKVFVPKLQNFKTFSLFSYDNRIFLKGRCLMDMEIVQNKIHIIKHTYLNQDPFSVLQSVVCQDKVYSTMEIEEKCGCLVTGLEIFCLKTYTSEIISQHSESDQNNVITKLIGTRSYGNCLRLFTMQDYNILSKSAEFINNLEIFLRVD